MLRRVLVELITAVAFVVEVATLPHTHVPEQSILTPLTTESTWDLELSQA